MAIVIQGEEIQYEVYECELVQRSAIIPTIQINPIQPNQADYLETGKKLFCLIVVFDMRVPCTK